MNILQAVRIGALLIPLAMTACSSENRQLTLAVSTEEPAPSIAETISSRLADDEIVIHVDIAADPAEIFEVIRNKQADLGVVEESDHPIPGVVTVAPLYPSVLHVLNDEQANPDDFVELIQQKKIYAGPLGGAAHRLLKDLADDFGVEDDQFEVLDNPWTVRPDVYFIFGGLLTNNSVRQLEGYTLFSFANADDVAGGSVADAIVLKHHHIKPFVLPQSTYYTLNDKPVVTLSIRTVMIAHEGFSPKLATEIAAILFNNSQEFSMDYPLVMRELDPAMNPANLMFPLHSSSRRFLNRDKPGFVERYVDIMALVLTVTLALASGLFALLRRQKQIKKDRVDDFYSKLLVVRKDAERTTDHPQLRLFRIKAIDVQQEVLQLLIDERISADASLLAFLSLSNQIINELDHRINYEVM